MRLSSELAVILFPRDQCLVSPTLPTMCYDGTIDDNRRTAN